MGYIYVPAEIDATGLTDVSAELTEFLRSVPDQSAVYFERNGKYRCESTVHLVNKTDVRLHGRGAVLFRTSDRYDSRMESQLRITGGHFIAVDDLALQGAGVGLFDRDCEGQHGIAAYGVAKLSIKGCEIAYPNGDGIYLASSRHGTSDTVTSGATVACNLIRGTGRHGVHHRAAAYSTVWGNRLSRIRLEPFATADECRFVTILDDNVVESPLPAA